MAKNTILSNPVTVTASDTTSTELQFTQSQIIPLELKNVNLAFIKVTVGTFQFNVGSDVVSTSASYTVGDVVPPIQFTNGAKNIFYKATTISDKFQIVAS